MVTIVNIYLDLPAFFITLFVHQYFAKIISSKFIFLLVDVYHINVHHLSLFNIREQWQLLFLFLLKCFYLLYFNLLLNNSVGIKFLFSLSI